MPSAIAAECADRQGRFHNMFQALYSESDSIGVKPWDRFAEDADVPDLQRFMQCVEEPEASFDRIAAGRALGEEIEITGTPQVFVNGRTFNKRDVSSFIDKAEELGLPSGG